MEKISSKALLLNRLVNIPKPKHIMGIGLPEVFLLYIEVSKNHCFYVVIDSLASVDKKGENK